MNRAEKIKNALTVKELSCIVFLDRPYVHHYREPFCNWVECYKTNQKPQLEYKTVKDFVEAIYKPCYDHVCTNYPAYREALIQWIENYRNV